MSKTYAVLAGLSGLTLLGCQGSGPGGAGPGESDAAVLANECRGALDELYARTPQAQEIADDAAGVLVFPNVVKAGLGVGGETGNGCLLEGGQVVSYDNKSDASFGLQAGAQSRSEVIMFMTDEALATVQNREGFEFGVDASAAVIDMGAGGTLDTNNIDGDVLAFFFGETGLMAAATLEGSKVTEINP